MGRSTAQVVALLSLGGTFSMASPLLGQGKLADLSSNQFLVQYSSARTGISKSTKAQADLYEKDELRTGPSSWAKVRYLNKPNELSVDRGSHVIVDKIRLTPFQRSLRPLLWSDAADASVQLTQQLDGTAPDREVPAAVVRQGAVFGVYGGPGIVKGDDAVVLVPKGQFEYRVDQKSKSTRVRCYSGTLLIGHTNAAVQTGVAVGGTTTTLIDDALAAPRVQASAIAGDTDSAAGGALVLAATNAPLHRADELSPRLREVLAGVKEKWIDGTLVLTSGPHSGESRKVKEFDPLTGTVTIAPPLASPIGVGTGYMLAGPEEFPLILPMRTEITVKDGQFSAVRGTFPRTFADGREEYWADLLPAVGALGVYPGSARHRPDLEELWPLDDDCVVRGMATCEVLPPRGDLGVTVSSVGGRTPAVGGGGSLPAAAVGGFSNVTWEINPYAIGSNEGETVGGRSNVRAVAGRLLATLGSRYGRFRGQDRTDVSELSLLYRFGQGGDLRVGRQFLYLGPVNNSRLGTLLGISVADAVVWSSPLARQLIWRVGYLTNSAPFEGDRFSGWFGRMGGPLGPGLWGVTVLSANRAGADVGATLDLSIPLVPRELSGYVEAGRDPFDQNLVTGGLYLTGLQQRTGVHLFLEYQSRQGSEDRWSVRLNNEIASHWLVVGYLFGEFGGSTSGGIGLRYRWRSH
jgi:hypothetical protein